MKDTGIIRRIDELGRIVIPKEIRKKLKINNGENIEIYIDEEEKIILKKYSNIKNIKDIAQKLTDTLYNFMKINIILTDNSNVVAASGNLKKEIINEELHDDILKKINNRENVLENNLLNITKNINKDCFYMIDIINTNGDINGSIIILKESEITKEEKSIINVATTFLSKYLEE